MKLMDMHNMQEAHTFLVRSWIVKINVMHIIMTITRTPSPQSLKFLLVTLPKRTKELMGKEGRKGTLIKETDINQEEKHGEKDPLRQ
jgi:hypothetical protein